MHPIMLNLLHLLIAVDAELELQRSSLVCLGKQYEPSQCFLRRLAAQSDVSTSVIFRSLKAVLRRL